MAYQSLYRRYRPQRFAEVVGQDNVTTALGNAVREQRTGHAYLFSGPRGTGKTSSARILAKALNCTDLHDGEPCGVCEACVAVEAGSSLDLFELDAASNNGVDAMRDLIAKASLGSPGRNKVYILDEVHMLTPAASNALLKTLEEPPPHVTFVLATTDPQKVLPTIRSRAQHYEFGLLNAAVLEAHVRDILGREEVELDDETIGYVVRRGSGSARDTLSALDQVLALGGRPTGGGSLDGLLDALVARDTGAAISALAAALDAGREPRLVGEELLGRLRDAFLLAAGGPVGQLPEDDRVRLAAVGRALGLPVLSRALEAIGTALTDMRQAPDARVPLEVALVRVTRPDTDSSLAALVERVAALEAALAAGVPAKSAAPASAAPASAAPAPAPAAPQSAASPVVPAADAPPMATMPPPVPSPAPAAGPSNGAPAGPPAAEARRRLQARQAGTAAASKPPPAPTPPAAVPTPTPTASAVPPAAHPAMAVPATAAAGGGDAPTKAEIDAVWEPLLATLTNATRARYKGGRFLDSDGPTAVFGLPNPFHLGRCQEKAGEVEQALAAHFGRRVPLRLEVDASAEGGGGGADPFSRRGAGQPGAPGLTDAPEDEEEDIGDVHALPSATDVGSTVLDRLLQAFPGAEVVE